MSHDMAGDFKDKKIPSHITSVLGQDEISCGATRLDACASTQRIPTYADFVNEVSSPSPILTL